MHFLTHQQLQQMFLKGFTKIIDHKQEINSINVFPVADQDTGSNLAKTVKGILTPLDSTSCRSINELSSIILYHALLSSQGNSGIILSAFLDGFFSEIKHEKTVTSSILLKAFINGSQTAHNAIEHPVKGTILDVMDAIVDLCQRPSDKSVDISQLLEKIIKTASKALQQTTNHMEIFKQANVVDAGGLGLIYLLEGFYEALSNKTYHNETLSNLHLLQKQKNISIAKNKYEVIFVVNECIMTKDHIKTTLNELGNSLDVAEIANNIKVHIHTDTPNLVKDIALSLGNIISLQIIDMTNEHILESINNL